MTTAIAFFVTGGPDVLQLVDIPEPQAAAGQVRVHVRAAGVQPFDLAAVRGYTLPGNDSPFPRIPGNEFAGVVDQVGTGVTDFGVGDEVLGFGTMNSYVEQLVVGTDQITAKPPNMPWEVAGGFSAGAQTAHIALREIGVGPGDTVLIHGAAGSVGTLAVQLSRLWGARVIGAAREAHHDHLRSLGADPVSYGDGFVERVRTLAPEGIHAALDAVGGEALQATLELVADRTRILTVVEHAKAAELGIRVTPAARSRERLAELVALYAAGRLRVHVLEAFPLARAADAHRRYMAGNIRGKIVLTMG